MICDFVDPETCAHAAPADSCTRSRAHAVKPACGQTHAHVVFPTGHSPLWCCRLLLSLSLVTSGVSDL